MAASSPSSGAPPQRNTRGSGGPCWRRNNSLSTPARCIAFMRSSGSWRTRSALSMRAVMMSSAVLPRRLHVHSWSTPVAALIRIASFSRMLAIKSAIPTKFSVSSGGNVSTRLECSRRNCCMSSPQRARKSATTDPTGSLWSMGSDQYVAICDDESTPASKRQPQNDAFFGVIRAEACAAQQFTHSASAEMWFTGRAPCFQAAERRVKADATWNCC